MWRSQVSSVPNVATGEGSDEKREVRGINCKLNIGKRVTIHCPNPTCVLVRQKGEDP